MILLLLLLPVFCFVVWAYVGIIKKLAEEYDETEQATNVYKKLNRLKSVSREYKNVKAREIKKNG